MFAISCHVSCAYVHSCSLNHYFRVTFGFSYKSSALPEVVKFYTMNIKCIWLLLPLNTTGISPLTCGMQTPKLKNLWHWCCSQWRALQCSPGSVCPWRQILTFAGLAVGKKVTEHSLGREEQCTSYRGHWTVNYVRPLISVRNNWILCLEPMVWSPHLENHSWLIFSLLEADRKWLKEV